MKTTVKKREKKILLLSNEILGAVPRMGRWSRCTYPFWVFASFLFFFLYYKFILYITRGAPNKAVEKKYEILIVAKQWQHELLRINSDWISKTFCGKNKICRRELYFHRFLHYTKPFVAAIFRATCHSTCRQGVTCRLDVLQRHVAKANFPFVNGSCHF